MEIIKVRTVHMRASVTDDALAEIIAGMSKTLHETGALHGFVLTIDGYDDDQRELDEVPEVMVLFRRLHDSGFISLLEAFTLVQKMSDPDHYGVGLGAFEVWYMVHKGKMLGHGRKTIPIPIIKEFVDVWPEFNVICDSWIWRAKNKGTDFIVVHEGQSKVQYCLKNIEQPPT